jgi:hypothetical protein
MVMFSIIVRNMERASVMKNIMPGWGRNLNLLFAVNSDLLSKGIVLQ